jgi:hypothetical protein
MAGMAYKRPAKFDLGLALHRGPDADWPLGERVGSGVHRNPVRPARRLRLRTTITAPPTTSSDIRRHKASNYSLEVPPGVT